MKRSIGWIAAALLVPAAVACGDDDDSSNGQIQAGLWEEVLPGGDTICSRGTEYRFYVRQGRSDRLIVDFQGGGACWNEGTCSVADALFRDSVSPVDSYQDAIDSGSLAGLFDPNGRFADWTIVHVPYCTGDIHWGNSVEQYNDDITINHKGAVNAQAALDWAYENVPSPDNIFVSGCSAGAYGAILHSAFLADHYSEATLSVLADSGAGIITDSFLNDSLPRWNAQSNLPTGFIPALDVPLNQLTLSDLYVEIGKTFPQHRYAQTSTNFDDDQTFFFQAMGGDPLDWPGRFNASIDAIAGEISNFRSYIAPGPMHCVTPYPFFDTRVVDGVNLAEWTEQLAVGSAMPDSVHCNSGDCMDDPVCDACTGAETDGRWCRFCRGWPEDYIAGP